MENLKIRVNSEAESKQAKSLLESLGFDIDFSEEGFKYSHLFAYVNGMHVTGDNREGHFKNKNNKEITLPELRDLVVLKRNDVGDATHKDYTGLKHLLLKNTRHVWGGEKWLISTADFSKLKPIEKKEMKEYLRKNSNGTYSYIGTVQPENVSDFMIEIPKTAELVLRNKQGKIEFFKDKCGSKFENGNWIGVSIPFARLQEGKILFLKGGCQAYWDSDFSKTLAAPFNLIESRHTLPEELPFIDDDPKITTAKGSELDYIAKIHDMRDRYNGESDEDYRYQLEHYISRKEPSLNDQYAEIEKVRHNHYFKDVSDVNQIDVYEVLKRFNVTDPCLQHIIKKALCAGQRGHKDLKNDLQDILDTAKRTVEINK